MACRAWNIALAGMVCCFSSTTLANNFNYNFFEVRASGGPQSLGVEFSTYLLENFHTVGRLDKRANKAFDLAGGVGFNGPAGPFLDINGQMLVHYAKADDDEHDDGGLLEINLGARLWLSQALEVHGKIGTISEHGLVEAGLRFHSTDQLTFGGQIRNNGLWGSQATLGVRLEF